MKAQVAIEFMYVMIFVLVIGGLLISVVAGQLSDIHQREFLQDIRDVARASRQEIFSAADVEDGYYREFKVPFLIRNQVYNLTVSQNTLTAFSGATGVVYSVPSVSGDFQLGTNTIRRAGGVIYLNS